MDNTNVQRSADYLDVLLWLETVYSSDAAHRFQ